MRSTRDVGRDLGFRTRKCLLLPARAQACAGAVGLAVRELKWPHDRLHEWQHCAHLHAAGKLTLVAMRQTFGIIRRLSNLSRDRAKMAALSNVDPRWP